MRKALLLTTVLSMLFAVAYGKTELVVYTAIENELLPSYKAAFEAENPDINVKWVRDSTGIITARLIAEKDNPQADAVLGLGSSSLIIMDGLGMLESYQPEGFELIDDAQKDTGESPVWTGLTSWSSALCVNKVLLAKENLPLPTSWQDLTNPIYKGKIAMPHPASSGSGYMNVSSWIQLWGDEVAWSYMDDLDANIKSYAHSGSKPCAMAAQGEVVIGISASALAEKLLQKRAPLEVIYPSEGLGWDTEANAIIKGTDQLQAAKLLMDWGTSEAAAKLGADYSGLPSRKEFMTEQGAVVFEKLAPNDLKWAAENRDAILKEWQSRYE